MSEAVEVIISADDQASKEFAKVAANAEIQQKQLAAYQAKAAAEAEKAAKDQIKAQEKAAAEAAKESQRIQDIRTKEIQQLQLLRTEIKHGADAAKSLSLQQQGLTKAEADALVRKRQELEKIRSASKSGDFRSGAGQVKASTEFAGSIAMMLGGTEFGAIASQTAQLTEKTSQFSEVAKQGGAAALAMKGGMMAMAFVAGTQLGSAISNLIFDFEKFDRQIESSKKRIDEFNAQAKTISQSRFAGKLADIELIKDPQQKQAAIEQLTSMTQREIDSLSVRVKESQRAVDEWAASWKVTGDRKGFEQQAQQQLEKDRELLALAKEQQQSLVNQAQARERAVIAAKQQADAQREAKAQEGFASMLQALDEEATLYMQGASAVANFRMEQAGLSQESQQILIAFREKNAALKLEYEERQKAIEKEKQAKATYDQSLGSLQKQRISIDQGAEAARRFELAQQGMTKAMVDNIVQQEKQNATDEKSKQRRESAKQLVKDEIEALKLKRIEIEQGSQAAEVASLVQRGVSEEQARQIAAEKERLRQLEESRQIQDSGPLQAKESRLLSRGNQDQLAVSKEQLQALYMIADKLAEQKREDRIKFAQVVR